MVRQQLAGGLREPTPSATANISTRLSFDERALWGLFSRYARVLGRSGGASDRIYPVDNLMLRDSARFYKWYTAELRSAIRTSVLKVELPCAQRQTERVFLVAAAISPSSEGSNKSYGTPGSTHTRPV
jgi:hypothetical protein